MKVTDSQKLPIKLWMKELSDMESGCWDQAKHLADLPFAFKHIAVMPDAHQGYGMPIGGVMATKNVIVPNAVGVDIGCGMCAVKTSLTDIDIETLKKIMGEIRKVIPLGFGHHKSPQALDFIPTRNDGLNYEICDSEFENARTQLGTLGGGNHFIEIQKGDDGHIWIMVHSGSRNLGFKVANHYNKLAIELNEKWHSSVPASWELAYLPVDSDEGQAYIREMNYCVDFALANRKLMMERVKAIFRNELMKKEKTLEEQIGFEPMINIAHNYASLENHFGQNVWVHRKGATKATKGLVGIIPGSMGTSSYIVEGLGNRESFMSCSHGAGRRMGRNEARRVLSLEEEQKKMEGIIGKPRSNSDLDEAPGAYKDIDEVMGNQEDLVKVLVKLSPMGVIKG